MPLVIVTGRSISWGHFLLTHFPYLNEVIVEGGGAMVYRQGDAILEKCFVSENDLTKLNQVVEKMAKHFPQVKLSVDSFGRKTDRAIELHDLADLQCQTSFVEIEQFLKSQEISFSTSNVHLNFWSGDISKYKAVCAYLESRNLKLDEGIFYGDSINDSTMFEHFPTTVGVSNIDKVLDRLKFKPSIVLEGDANEGPYGVLNHLKSSL